MGNLTILIGPNGYGKTYALENVYKKKLLDEGIDNKEIFYMPAEIYLEDEVKDTDNSTSRSKTMEFLLTDLFDMDEINILTQSLHEEYNKQITKNQDIINGAFDAAANKNGATRRNSFISKNTKFTISKAITINAKDFKELIGSGQKYYFFLQLLLNSKKKYIFLDEPEQYSHPSMQNSIAKIITELINQGKDVFIATHSPKLLSMLDIRLGQIRIINDETHERKMLDLNNILIYLNSRLNKAISSMSNVDKAMYDINYCEELVRKYYYREFIEALFTKKIFLVEGASDELFVKNILNESGHYYDDYVIFKTHGKFKIPLFAKIFQSFGIDIRIYMDTDKIEDNKHKDINDYIYEEYKGCYYAFQPILEKELGISGNEKVNSPKLVDFLHTWKYDSKYDIWNLI